MKNFKKLIKEAYLGNPLSEVRTTPVSGTKAGVTYSLNSDRKLVLKKDVEGARIGDYTNITLPKGTVIYNLPGGVFAAHESLKKFATNFNPYYEKPTYSGISVIRSRDTLAAIEDAANLNETAGTFGDGVSDKTKAKYNEAAMDEYGKPFAELSIEQKQELMRAIVKYSGPEFDTDYTKYRKEMSDYVNEELLKEFTVPGGNYRDSYANRLPEEQLSTPEDYELFMEMFPRGEASRILMDPNRKKLFDQHLEWTKDSQYNNVFQHMQYHEVEHEGELYKVHQTQYYNTNYKDFRNPRFTELMISKDGKRMGTYLVDTTEYVKDLRDLEVKDRVMEGTCGYGEGGVTGDKPAGAHLQKEESEGDKEIRALEKKAEKYPKGDSRREVIQKKIGDLKSDKDYALPGSKADKKFSDMEENMNDPVLVKTRASQMKRDKIEADEKAKKSYLDTKYGPTFMDKLEAEIDLKNELQNLEKEREDVLMRIEDIGFETEQTAEPEGGKIADKLSRRLTAAEKELRAIDNKIIDVKDELGHFRMYESVNESKYGVDYEDKNDGRHYIEIEASSKKEAEDKVSGLDGFRMIKSIGKIPAGAPLQKEGYLERAIKDEKDPKKLAILKAKKEFFDSTPKEKRREMSDDEIRKAINKLVREDLQLDVDLYSKENPGIFSRADERIQVTIPGKFGDNEGDTALQKALADLGKEYTSYKVKDVKELNEDGDGGAEPNDGELDIKSSSDAALDNAVKDMGYNESKGFDFKKMVKEALTPKNLK